MNGSFGDNVGVEAVTEIDGIDVITVRKSLVSSLSIDCNKHALDKYGPNCSNYAGRAAVKGAEQICTHHSKSLYMIVKKT